MLERRVRVDRLKCITCTHLHIPICTLVVGGLLLEDVDLTGAHVIREVLVVCIWPREHQEDSVTQEHNKVLDRDHNLQQKCFILNGHATVHTMTQTSQQLLLNATELTFSLTH